MAKKCPKLRFVVDRDIHGFEITAWRRGEEHPVGAIDVDTPGFASDHPDQARVQHITVAKLMQRCGIGTQLYTRAVAEAKKAGLLLTSDSQRTPKSEGFWQKQRRKGRAICVDKKRGHGLLPGQARPEVDHWDCRRFQMKPGTTSLARLKRKKR